MLFGNNTEALALAKSLGWNLNNEEEELEEIAQKLGNMVGTHITSPIDLEKI